MHLPEIAKARVYVSSGRGKEGPTWTNQDHAWRNCQHFHQKKEGRL